MDKEIREVVETIHDQPGRIVLVTAGAGTQALAWLLGVAGASRTLLEAIIPYDAASFVDFLGQTPEQHVADSTARLLAGKALQRARFLNSSEEPSIGVACTATIITDRPKRGQHRAHIAIWTAGQVTCSYIKLKKSVRQREGEEDMVSRIILNDLAQAMAVDLKLPLKFADGDIYNSGGSDMAVAVDDLQRGSRACFEVTADGRLVDGPKPKAVLSGAFNPLHDGHLDLARVGEEISGLPVAFELSAVNAEKGALDQDQTLDRLAQFAGIQPAIVSSGATFQEKARLYPRALFIVGVDTAERVLHPRYYGDSEEGMLAALAEIERQGCRFLVAGRVDQQGVFKEASEVRPPAPFQGLFEPIPQEAFRHDVSSSILRERGQ